MMGRGKNYFNSHCFTKIVSYILENQNEAYVALKADCERLMDNRFLFNDNWDMEPCPKAYQILPMQWDVEHHHDEEWTFMLNRQNYLWKLLLVYQVEKQVGYLDKVKFFMLNWITSVQQFDPHSPTTRTLDTGIRCLSWIKTLLFLQEVDAIDEASRQLVLSSLEKQIHFLVSHYRLKYTLSNWGIFQTVAIIVAYHYFKNEINIEEAYEFASKELCEQVSTQILEDGTQFEQSILYHVEVYKVLLELIVFVPTYQDDLLPILHKMAYYIKMMTAPDGKTIALGDSDNHQTADILHLSAILLDEEAYLPDEDFPLDLYSLFLLGQSGLEKFSTLKAKWITSHSRVSSGKTLRLFDNKLPNVSNGIPFEISCFKDSGHSCMKLGQSYLFFKCGPIGSAHTHSDNGSFCLYHNAQPIFIDSGRYTYRDCSERYYLKSAWAHNSCLIDRKTPEVISDSWGYANYPQANYHQLVVRNGSYLVEGTYSCLNKSRLSYSHNRQILAVNEHIFLIVDTVHCLGSHQLTTQFILDEKVTLSNGQINHLRYYSKMPMESVSTQRSTKYNQLSQTQKLVKHMTFQDAIVDYTLFAEQSITVVPHNIYQSDGRFVTNGFAFEVISDTTHQLIVWLAEDIYQGEKLLIVKGIKLRGKCLVVDLKAGKITRLKA